MRQKKEESERRKVETCNDELLLGSVVLTVSTDRGENGQKFSTFRQNLSTAIRLEVL
jgi:hypothetical protein